MKNTNKLLGMTAAVALLSTSAIAATMEDGKYWIDTDGDGYAETSIENQLVAGQTFDVLDDNNDGRVSMKEFQNNTILEGTAEDFALRDPNQDGYITPMELYTTSKFGNGELTNAQNDNAYNGTKIKSASGQQIGSMRSKYYQRDEAFFADATADNDGMYWPEGLTLDAGRVQPNQPLFNQIDDNNNGVISFPEFQANTIHNNEYEVFAMFDKNQDDAISQYEFNKYDKMGGTR